MEKQRGYITWVLVTFGLLMGILIFPLKFPSKGSFTTGKTNYCREFINDPNSRRIEIPDTPEGSSLLTYRLIKQNVPIKEVGYTGDHHILKGGNIEIERENYQIFYPTPDNGRSYDFNTEDGVTDISFIDYGLIFLLHLDGAGQPEYVDVDSREIQMIDIYQDIGKPPLENAENILKCVDVGVESFVNPQVVVPKQKISETQKELQLQWFLLKQSQLLPKAWWTPECKPAIYLYPPKKQLVNVKVDPLGELAYTDPLYDFSRGWTVWAEPTGDLYQVSISRFQEEKRYDYLYYESKIYDWEIKKPEEGWVVKYDELERLYEEILPKLGLNAQEKADFTGYWLEKLPRSEYYFVGVIDKTQRDHIEPLSVIPEPETSIRFSLYFEPLEEFKVVSEPMIITPVRKGFTLVDWGGMVKLHPGTPFTCSQ